MARARHSLAADGVRALDRRCQRFVRGAFGVLGVAALAGREHVAQRALEALVGVVGGAFERVVGGGVLEVRERSVRRDAGVRRPVGGRQRRRGGRAVAERERVEGVRGLFADELALGRREVVVGGPLVVAGGVGVAGRQRLL